MNGTVHGIDMHMDMDLDGVGTGRVVHLASLDMDMQ